MRDNVTVIYLVHESNIIYVLLMKLYAFRVPIR